MKLARTLLHARGTQQTPLNIMFKWVLRTPSFPDLGNSDYDEIRACTEGGWSKGVMGHLARPLPPAWSPFAPTYSSSHLGCSDSANHCSKGLEGEEKE